MDKPLSEYQSPQTWQSSHPFFKNLASLALRNWLSNRDSLTQALICACADNFSVKVFKENWQKPSLNECRALDIKPNSLAFVRQVHLFCGNQAWVYARTVIPKNTLHGELQKLTQLGTRPLGAVLFANKHIQRGNIELTKISRKHKTHRIALTYSEESSNQIWGRRSLFYIKDKPLIVSEIFLPDLQRKQSCAPI